jgi:hypothetical protein
MANLPYHITVAGVALVFVPSLYWESVHHLSYILGIRFSTNGFFFFGLDRFYYKYVNESASSLM